MQSCKKTNGLISPDKLAHVLMISFNKREMAEFLIQRMTEEDVLTFIDEHSPHFADMQPTNQEFAFVTRTKANIEFRKQIIRDNLDQLRPTDIIDILFDEMTPRSIIKLSDKIWNKQ